MFKPASKKMKKYLIGQDSTFYWYNDMMTSTQSTGETYYVFETGDVTFYSKCSAKLKSDVWLINFI